MTLPDASAIPGFIYGTAWKEERTEPLVVLALEQGFRGIDTANQRRHYHEAAVGQAISAAIKRRTVSRDDLFLQSKFTFRHGQDHRLPYDPKAAVGVQVEQSFASSLVNLGVERIDSYLLHGPSQRVGLGPDDWAAWQAMEAIHDSGQARLLGVSNFNLQQLQQLCQTARVRPSFVQNRCYAVRAWDREVREFCEANAIAYQGFSLLTANQAVLNRPEITQIAKRHQRSVAQVIFRFAIDIGMLPLTGTTNAQHMREDLDVVNFQLTPQEVALIEPLTTS